MFNVLQTFNLYIEKGKLSLTVVNLLNVFITDAMGNDFCVTIMSLRFWQLSAPHAKINTRSINSFGIINGVYMYLLISLVNNFTLFYDKSDNNNSLNLSQWKHISIEI